ncbi:MAG: hypothetical protein AUG20_03490 [Gemmatimonas sp. 13_1_20CM_3_60_15]|nr:MAG: hypothetical protein AUG20_03490 [Gemmatimonas sp. 13_1_20CM_3_60_15]
MKLLVIAAVLATNAHAVAAQQTWNDARTLALVTRATERRASQIADTTLVDYKATAHGYVTFLAQFGEGFPEPPKIVKADELGLEVYWRAPDLSKQRIMGRRDTLLLPTDINYHRDHLGIVQNNFRNVIRIGEGDEVRDVPHPLSPSGLQAYDFAVRDSLQIRLSDRVLDVYEVRVRPKDDRQPRTVGSVYIDRESSDVVRMTFSFTRAALIDKELEDVSVVLENALIEGRYWLPRRQEIEIRRTGSWMDYPARGIIRGRWEICCYEINQGIPANYFAGPEIVMAPPSDSVRCARCDGRRCKEGAGGSAGAGARARAPAQQEFRTFRATPVRHGSIQPCGGPCTRYRRFAAPRGRLRTGRLWQIRIQRRRAEGTGRPRVSDWSRIVAHAWRVTRISRRQRGTRDVARPKQHCGAGVRQ